MVPNENDAGRAGWLRVLGWAAYLACSWTWCIGMFLPVLLVRDYGVWGFVVFAVPNVVGAGAMGWVLRSCGAAERIVGGHRWAVRRFTWITIVFHFFFLGWLAAVIVPEVWLATGFDRHTMLLLLALGSGVATIAALVAWGKITLASIVMWIVSVVTGTLVMRLGAWDDLTHVRNAAMFRSFRGTDLAMLAPACVFGFALCPYLDATFLNARRELNHTASKVAFGLGFGVLFLLMILITLGYSATVRPALVPIPSGGLAPRIVIALFSHIVLQAVFTIAVHTRAVTSGDRSSRRFIPITAIVCAALAFSGYHTGDYNYKNMMLGEVIYRIFMSFYGLVFPAYVWICMIPTRSGESSTSRHAGLGGRVGRVKLVVWLACIVMAAPCYWMGFIERETAWLVPGLLVVLLARAVVVWRVRRSPLAMH